MIRVLVALDNFGQLSQVEALFKKVGFDIDCVNLGGQFESVYLGLNPRVVVLSSHGKNIHGIELAKKINRIDGWPKLMMIIPETQELDMSQFEGINVDYFIESPVNPILMLQKVAQLSGELESDALSEKLDRLKGSLAESDPDNLLKHFESLRQVRSEKENAGIMGESSMTSGERSQRYKVWADKVGPLSLDKSFPGERVKRYKKEIRDAEALEPELEAERSEFVKALFSDDES